MKIKRGSTSVRRLIFIADTSKTDGSGLPNLLYDSSGLVAYYYAGDLSNEVQITLATATLGTWTSGGFVAVDNTNMPGWYEIGIPDAALDGGNEVAIQLRGATNMAPVNIYIELDAVDYQTAAFGALQPTTAGRTLDVTATGAAGIDWGNVENQTTTVALPNTTINTGAIVTGVYAALPADHTVAGSYGARFILALNSNRTLQLTGSYHAAADVHEFQPDVLTSAATDVSFVNELQSGLATSIALATAQADLDDIQTRLPAALVSGRMDSAVGDIDPAVVTIIQTGLSTLTAAQVNAEIVDALSVDTYAEPTAVPAASSSLKDKLAWLFMLARNRLTQTASTQTVFRDDTTTPAATAAVSDDGTTATRSEFQ